MKVNGITALDYERQGNSLALILSGATFEEVSTMDTALLEVRTDDGDLVEAFPALHHLRHCRPDIQGCAGAGNRRQHS